VFPREHMAHGTQREKRPRTQLEGGAPASYRFYSPSVLHGSTSFLEALPGRC